MRQIPPKKNTHAPGVTLIELTVVILVLLTLISVLFIGAKAYKDAADRSSCILNIRNVQQAVRSDQNIKGRGPAASGLLEAEIYDATGTKYLPSPVCPSGGVYDFQTGGNYPAAGDLAMVCSKEITDDHKPKNNNGW